MGNYQIIDACIRVGEGVIASGIKSTDGISSFDITSTSRNIFVNTGSEETSLDLTRISLNDYPANFIINSANIDNYLFKETVKKEIANCIYTLQYSKEFDSFIKGTVVKNASELVNLFSISVDDFFSVNMITRNVAYAIARDSESAYTIDFVDSGNYPSALVYYARENIQNFYSALVVRCFLDTFIQDSRISSITGSLKQKLNNANNNDKTVTLISFTMIFGVILISIVSLFYITQQRKNDIVRRKFI